MNKRQLKKQVSTDLQVNNALEWLNDLNAFLLETILEDEPQVELIVKQFKQRMTKGRNRKRYSGLTATRMRTYVKMCLGRTYGRECKR